MTVVINGTTGITSVNGSAAAPSVTGTDTDTGIVYGTNTLSLATGGTTAVTVDSSQNVGIGTSSPADKLDVARSSGADSSGGLTLTNTSSSGYGSAVSWKHALNGVAGVWGRINVEAATSTSSFMRFYTATGSALTEKMQIDGSGNLLVGKTSASASTAGFWVVPDGTIYSSLAASTAGTNTNLVYSTGAAAYRFYVGMEGKVYCTSTTITGISDQRLKENIRDLDDGLEKVMALQPRKFDWKEGKGKGIANDRGFIAQEFAQVFPDMIDEWLDPAPEGEEPYKAVNANLVPTLVKAIQELKAELDAAKADIATLKATA